jgi:hypothetical protein
VNWYAVTWCVLVVSVLASIVAFSVMMANLECGTSRAALRFAVVVAVLFVADALLIGRVMV